MVEIAVSVKIQPVAGKGADPTGDPAEAASGRASAMRNVGREAATGMRVTFREDSRPGA
jgi:hypothetical protein